MTVSWSSDMAEKRGNKGLIWVLSIALAVFLCAFLAIFIHEDYPARLYDRFWGHDWPEPHSEQLLAGWQQSLAGYHADIVFYGDSLTWGGNWQQAIPGSVVCNLGVRGDSVAGLLQRLPLVETLRPQQCLVMIGVNDLAAGKKPEQIAPAYDALFAKLQDLNIEVYMQSILPVREPSSVSNQRIVEMNTMIRDCALQYGMIYIDLYTAFVDEEGQLKEEYSLDGIHLNAAGYDAWYEILRSYL